MDKDNDYSEEARLAEVEYLTDRLNELNEIGLPKHLADKLKITRNENEIIFTFSDVKTEEQKEVLSSILGSTVEYMNNKLNEEKEHAKQKITDDIEGI